MKLVFIVKYYFCFDVFLRVSAELTDNSVVQVIVKVDERFSRVMVEGFSNNVIFEVLELMMTDHLDTTLRNESAQEGVTGEVK